MASLLSPLLSNSDTVVSSIYIFVWEDEDIWKVVFVPTSQDACISLLFLLLCLLGDDIIRWILKDASLWYTLVLHVTVHNSIITCSSV